MQLLTSRPEQSFRAHVSPDRRRHKRVKLIVDGRFMRSNKEEFACRSLALSVGGADIVTDQQVEVGERIVIYLEHLGGLEGDVTRVFDGGFVMHFRATLRRQQKLAAQLTWLLNQSELSAAEQRRSGHDRIKLDRKPITVTLADGAQTQCSAIDVSISGAKIESALRPEIGSEIQVGKLRARVARHFDNGFSVQFVDIQEVKAIRRYFG